MKKQDKSEDTISNRWILEDCHLIKPWELCLRILLCLVNHRSSKESFRPLESHILDKIQKESLSILMQCIVFLICWWCFKAIFTTLKWSTRWPFLSFQNYPRVWTGVMMLNFLPSFSRLSIIVFNKSLLECTRS